MRRLFWIIQGGPKCNHKCSYKRNIEGDLTTHGRGEGNMTTGVETEVMQPWAKELWQPSEAGRGKE